jgi:hypothetical protein
MDTRPLLAKQQCNKIHTLLKEFSDIERNAKQEDKKALYLKHELILDIELDKYFKKLIGKESKPETNESYFHLKQLTNLLETKEQHGENNERDTGGTRKEKTVEDRTSIQSIS